MFPRLWVLFQYQATPFNSIKNCHIKYFDNFRKVSSIKCRQLIEQPFTDPFQPTHQKGPDYIIPTEEYRTWLPNGATKILFNKNFEKEPESIVTFFRTTVEAYPDQFALLVKRNGKWQTWTYKQYLDHVRIAAKGFIKLGLAPFHGVGILGSNAPEWVISHLAATFSGGFAAGMYTSNSPEACHHILDNCKANVVIVEDEIQLDKILQIRQNLPHLKAIIQYIGTPNHPDVFSWEDVMQIGLSLNDDVLDRRIKGLAINQCFTLIYTSGTTGHPKGVMLSHDNMAFEVAYFSEHGMRLPRGKGVTSVSYLPLSHVAALFIDMFTAIRSGAAVYFAPPDALKGSLVDTLTEVKPIGFVGVPRVYEKIYEKIKIAELNMNFIQRNLFLWALNEAAKYNALGKMKPKQKPISFLLADKLILNKVKQNLGLERAEYVTCGSAPFSKEVHQFFTELNITVVEAYGLSESCGIHTMNEKDDIKVGSVGNVKAFPACEIKLKDPDENGCGELLLRGRNVCLGYLGLKDQTIETIDENRWLHTGDIGKIDKFGLLQITGRIKELIITSGGENIPPLIIEDEIKKHLPIVSNCMVVGDMRKYLTMLLTLKTELDKETLLPTDQLSLPALKWCREIGSSATTASEVIRSSDKRVWAAIQCVIDKYNKEKALSRAQRIQKWTILPIDFSIPNGELGPTAKLKRLFILEKYSKEIDKMYS